MSQLLLRLSTATLKTQSSGLAINGASWLLITALNPRDKGDVVLYGNARREFGD